MHILRREVLNWLPEEATPSIIVAYQNALKAGQLVVGLPVDEDAYWADLGTAEQYIRAHGEIADEVAVDLEVVEREALEVEERPEAGTEVVERELAAQRVQPDRERLRLLEIRDRRRFHPLMQQAQAEQPRRRAELEARGVQCTGALGLGTGLGVPAGSHLHNVVLWDNTRLPRPLLYADGIFVGDDVPPAKAVDEGRQLTPERQPAVVDLVRLQPRTPGECGLRGHCRLPQTPRHPCAGSASAPGR